MLWFILSVESLLPWHRVQAWLEVFALSSSPCRNTINLIVHHSHKKKDFISCFAFQLGDGGFLIVKHPTYRKRKNWKNKDMKRKEVRKFHKPQHYILERHSVPVYRKSQRRHWIASRHHRIKHYHTWHRPSHKPLFYFPWVSEHCWNLPELITDAAPRKHDKARLW